MDKVYILCKVDVLLPDTSRAKSHVEHLTYVVNPQFYGNFVSFISGKYDFYGIVNCGQLISHLPKYVNSKFTLL